MTRDEAAGIYAREMSAHGWPFGRSNIYCLVDVLAALGVLYVDKSLTTLHSEHDPDVRARARNAADKPYDMDTCQRYPWAAAARIAYLEELCADIKAKLE